LKASKNGQRLRLVLAAIIAALAVTSVCWMVVRASRTSGHAAVSEQQYATDLIMKFCRSWEPAELRAQMLPELSDAVSSQALSELADKYRTGLGRIVSVDRIDVVKSRVSFSFTGSSSVRAKTLSHCRFEKGKGSVTIDSTLDRGAWKVAAFKISSPQLDRYLPGGASKRLN
jgi:hypothetical protein